MLTVKDVAATIDHSLLKPDMTDEMIREGCRLAKKYGTATVCVRPTDLPIAAAELRVSDVRLSTVIGFPHGSNRTDVKVFEAERAIDDGAVELDMVLNVGKLLSEEFDYVEQDIRAVVEVAHKRGALVKVILENCYLTDELKVKACQIAEKVGADFVKTSTGYGSGGATIHDLKLMRATCSHKVRVKAAGGVRTLDSLLAARAAGAVRCGATATKAIMDEAEKRAATGDLKESEYAELEHGY